MKQHRKILGILLVVFHGMYAMDALNNSSSPSTPSTLSSSQSSSLSDGIYSLQEFASCRDTQFDLGAQDEGFFDEQKKFLSDLAMALKEDICNQNNLSALSTKVRLSQATLILTQHLINCRNQSALKSEHIKKLSNDNGILMNSRSQPTVLVPQLSTTSAPNLYLNPILSPQPISAGLRFSLASIKSPPLAPGSGDHDNKIEQLNNQVTALKVQLRCLKQIYLPCAMVGGAGLRQLVLFIFRK